MAKFNKSDTQVLGISVDSSPANHAFAKQIGVTFPLLSDFHRNVSEEYGVLNKAQDFANRTTFVLNKLGIITHIEVGAQALSPNGAVDACSLMEHKRRR